MIINNYMVKDRLKKICIKRDPIRVKQIARKQLRAIAKKCLYDRSKFSFREYLVTKRKNDVILNQLLQEARLEADSAESLNEFMDYKEPGTGKETNVEYPKRFLEDEKMEDNINFNYNYIETKIKRRGVMNQIEEIEEEKKEEKKEEINADGKNDNNNEENKNNKEENKKNDNNNNNKTEEEEKKEDEENIDKEEREDKDDDDEIMGEVNEELNEAPGPLEGKQIVITGETMVPKEYFRVLLARLGARVTFSVSNKTTLLIYGSRLEDGRKFFEGIKYKAAMEKDIPTYSDKDFEQYMQELSLYNMNI